jgi:hypothetical protein
MTDYKINDFGEAKLIVEKRGDKREIICSGRITMVDKKMIWFTDNEGYPYLVERKNF